MNEFAQAHPSHAVYALTPFDDPIHGSSLYAGGLFRSVGGLLANRIARWDGADWHSLGDGVYGTTQGSINGGYVLALLVHENAAHGPRLFVGGDFIRAGSQNVACVASWDGQSWHSLPGVIPDEKCIDCPVRVNSFVPDPTSATPRLIASGMFEYVHACTGFERVKNIIAWDGDCWTPLGSGLHGTALVPAGLALAAFGGSVYAGGMFWIAGGVPAQGIARWDGQAWHDVGGGINYGRLLGIFTMTTFDDGNGESLYVGGTITGAGNVQVWSIARWDGSQWHDVGGGVNTDGKVYAMTVFDDGSGPALFIGGEFHTAGGIPASNIAKWDGKAWSALGEGTNGAVRALAVWDRDGEGPEPPGLYVGGEFTMAGGFPSPNIAKWQGCPSCYADCDTQSGSGILDIFDFLCFGNRFATNDPYACDCDTSTGPGVCDVFDFLCFGNAFSAGCP